MQSSLYFGGREKMKKAISGILSAAAVTAAMLPSVPVMAESGVKTGDYIKLGTYNDMPIIWRCVDIDEYGALMLSDKIITIKPYDAAGMTAGGSHGREVTRRSTGSNFWGDANIRDWLNSESDKVEWTCKNPPTDKAVVDGNNAYSSEPGFLTGFTDAEKSLIKDTEQKTIVAGAEHENGIVDTGTEDLVWKAEIDDVVQNYDSAYGVLLMDRVFLPDVKQINKIWQNGTILGEDYYIGEPTAQAVVNSEFKSSLLSVGKKYSYWARTPYTDTDEWVVLDKGSVVRYVNADGLVTNNAAYISNIGVRPAFYLADKAAFAYGDGSKMAPYSLTEDDVIKVTLNGDRILFDQPPVIVDERTLVPLRAIFENMGYTVSWDGETQTATAVNGDDFISVTVGGQDILYTTGGETGVYTCDVPAQIISERTLVPVRAISESAGCSVDWDGETQTVIIKK